MMIVATPPSKGIRSRKRKRETEEANPSADAVLENDGPHDYSTMKNSGLQEELIIQESGRGAGGNGSLDDSENEGGLQTQKENAKRGSTSGQTWEVDIGKE